MKEEAYRPVSELLRVVFDARADGVADDAALDVFIEGSSVTVVQTVITSVVLNLHDEDYPLSDLGLTPEEVGRVLEAAAVRQAQA